MEKCIVCEEPRQHGIHLYTSFICTTCEEAMIHTSTKDPVYKHYVKQLRVIKDSKILS